MISSTALLSVYFVTFFYVEINVLSLLSDIHAGPNISCPLHGKLSYNVKSRSPKSSKEGKEHLKTVTVNKFGETSLILERTRNHRSNMHNRLPDWPHTDQAESEWSWVFSQPSMAAAAASSQSIPLTGSYFTVTWCCCEPVWMITKQEEQFLALFCVHIVDRKCFYGFVHEFQSTSTLIIMQGQVAELNNVCLSTLERLPCAYFCEVPMIKLPLAYILFGTSVNELFFLYGHFKITVMLLQSKLAHSSSPWL